MNRIILYTIHLFSMLVVWYPLSVSVKYLYNHGYVDLDLVIILGFAVLSIVMGIGDAVEAKLK